MKKKKQQNKYNYVNERKKFSNMFKYFFKIMAIAFVPILIIDVLLGYLLKGQHEWLIWLITFVGLVIAGIIGLVIESQMMKQRLEEEQKRKKHGKSVPKREDIDIFGE